MSITLMRGLELFWGSFNSNRTFIFLSNYFFVEFKNFEEIWGIDLFSLGSLFSHFRSCDILQRIILLSI